MLHEIILKIFGDPSEKKVREYRRIVTAIRAREQELIETLTTFEAVQEHTRSMMALFDELDRTAEDYQERMRAILMDIRVEAFATHSVACRLLMGREFALGDRTFTWNMIPFDVQIMGALALHDGCISEMRTGEGKTLVATIAAYLNALTGTPVHIVTVNDYLAHRDASEMGIIYVALGLTVGCVMQRQQAETKRPAYKSNVVYVTNNELGFDYLRDNMTIRQEDRVLGPLQYAIIDEVDSILIDEARTPLIISAPDDEPTSKYQKFAILAKQLKKDKHYKLDEKQRTVVLTEDGIIEIERMLGIENIYVSEHYNDIHHIENALKAEYAYRRDVEYLVRDDNILIIDEHTGRTLFGRRYSDGLHQAIEAKENVKIQQESRTLASITFQNYFRLYRKLSGMTGTAKTEEEEFFKIYHLEVIAIPTNRTMIRADKPDCLFKNEKGKYAYLVNLIRECHKHGQPVLVGTVSVEKSEYLSELLTRENIPHRVLNAKQDAHEAEIIGDAGRFGSVTIATNMAGRGTDIKVDDQVRALTGTIKLGYQEYPLGGLYVIGTEKHETRRIDNQLRGRSGRQGDPGLSQFMVSPQDDIMRIFGGDKLFGIFNAPMFASLPEDEPLAESRMLTNRITSVQKQVEGRNFDIRKHVLEYDDVLNQHRIVIYSRRNRILEQESIHDEALIMFREQCQRVVEKVFEDDNMVEWDFARLITEVNTFFATNIVADETFFDGVRGREEVGERIYEEVLKLVESIIARFTSREAYDDYEKRLTLQSIDELWMAHLDVMTHLREEVAFEGYAQKNPLIVYKERAYEKFVGLLEEIGFKVVKGLLSASPAQDIIQVDMAARDLELTLDSVIMESIAEAEVAERAARIAPSAPANTSTPTDTSTDSGIRVYRVNNEKTQSTPVAEKSAEYKNVGRNDPCPCGSGKKFKQCHGK